MQRTKFIWGTWQIQKVFCKYSSFALGNQLHEMLSCTVDSLPAIWAWHAHGLKSECLHYVLKRIMLEHFHELLISPALCTYCRQISISFFFFFKGKWCCCYMKKVFELWYIHPILLLTTGIRKLRGKQQSPAGVCLL